MKNNCTNHERLAHSDLVNLLKGKEQASRFFSTFIVNHLEGRLPAVACIYHRDGDDSQRRRCHSVFEAITFELLCDSNGMVCQRSSDPLFAILEAGSMMGKDLRIIRQACLPCDACRLEFHAIVNEARETFWRLLPDWFGINLTTWG